MLPILSFLLGHNDTTLTYLLQHVYNIGIALHLVIHSPYLSVIYYKYYVILPAGPGTCGNI